MGELLIAGLLAVVIGGLGMALHYCDHDDRKEGL